MVKKGVDSFFDDFLKKEPLFKNKNVLQANYSPDNIPHREEYIEKVAGILAPALRIEKPSNMFIYGKTGSGKTLVVKHVTESMEKIAASNGLALKIFYLNCKMKRVADTEYRLIAEMARALGVDIPATGLPTDEVYSIFVDNLEKEKILLVLIIS